LAGIVFLGVEIRETNTQARIATTQVVVDQLAGWKEMIAGDGELSEIYAKGMAEFSHLSPLEQTRFDLLMRAFNTRISGIVLAREAGLLNPDVGELNQEQLVVEGEFLLMLDQPGFRDWWSTADRRGMSQVTIKLIETLEALRDSQ
jgi:hypothetical protein